jgi:hypothetical protein
MKQLTAAWAAAMLMSGDLALAGLGAGIAQADDDCRPAAMVNHVCWGPNRWCPGDSLFHLTQNHVHNPVTWDMNVCHTYYHVAFDQGNQGQGIYEGPNPPPPQSLPPRGPYLPPPPGMSAAGLVDTHASLRRNRYLVNIAGPARPCANST